jgi:hypothetical protein
VNLAVIAAFTAATVSILNIILTAWLNRGSQFLQWQREQARPIAARVLTHSDEARLAWMRGVQLEKELRSLGDKDKKRAGELEEQARKFFAANRDAFDKLRFEAAQLTLIATPQTREAARALMKHHMDLAMPDIPQLVMATRRRPIAEMETLIALEAALIDTFRADLGLPSDPRWLVRKRKNTLIRGRDISQSPRQP